MKRGDEVQTITISGNSEVYFASSTSEQFEATKKFVGKSIIPLFEQFDNITYMGMYESGTEAKYLLDVGFDTYAFMVYVSARTIYNGICKKADTESLGYIKRDTSGMSGTQSTHTESGVNYYSLQFDGSFKVVKKNGDEVLALFTFDSANKAAYVFDVDNFGNKYIGSPRNSVVYYDDGNFLAGAFNTTSITNDFDDTVYMEDMYLLQSNKLKGISTSMKRIFNTAFASGAYSLIEVEGIRYRQLYNYYWIVESEG